MRTAWNRWAVALRIARRGALHSWGRSLLVMALVAAPVAALSAASIVLASTQSTLDERLQNQLGHAQAELMVVGSPGAGIEQGVEGGYDYEPTDQDSTDTRVVDPRTVLPSSVKVLAVATGAATFRTAAGAASLVVQTGPSWDPSLDGGPYALLSGRRPTGATEVLLSPAAVTRLGAAVGSTITMLDPSKRMLTVVGTARDRSLPTAAQTVFGATTLLPATATNPQSTAYYVPDAPIDWATVERLNRAGTTVFSRAVVAHPPTLPAARQYGGGGGFNVAQIAVIVIALVFVVLEVALLAGAAFAVGARLQQRMLATVASVGGDRGVLRRVVTASGIVLGAAGGLAGVGLGVVGAVVLMQLTTDGSWRRYPGLHVNLLLLIGIVGFGALVGWLSALVPARAAGKIDVVRALRGARMPQRIGRTPVLGIVLLAAGVVLTLAGGAALLAVINAPDTGGTVAQLGALALLGGGPVLAQVGVILCAGLVLRTIARLLARAPLSARLAARDTSRNLGRAVPAVAAVMTTVFVASFAMCIANTVSIYSATHYGWSVAVAGQGQAYIATAAPAGPNEAYADRWVAALRHDLPVQAASVVRVSTQGGYDPKPSTRAKDALPSVHFFTRPGSCTERRLLDPTDLVCGPFTAEGGLTLNAQNWVTVGSADTLALVLGHAPSAAARSELAGGGVVALRSDLAPGGHARLDWFTPAQSQGDTSVEHPVRRTELPAVVDLPAHPIEHALFMTPATAASLHIATMPSEVLLQFTRMPTQTELDAANSALGALANSPDAGHLVSVETGPQDVGSLIAWYILLACLIIAISAGATAIGLARVDGRADDVTFEAVGAPPRIRRGVALVQALIICGTGAVIGTALGLLPAAAIGIASVSYVFAPPALQLLLTAFGIPVVIALGSWLLVGRRTDVARRPAIG